MKSQRKRRAQRVPNGTAKKVIKIYIFNHKMHKSRLPAEEPLDQSIKFVMKNTPNIMLKLIKNKFIVTISFEFLPGNQKAGKKDVRFPGKTLHC